LRRILTLSSCLVLAFTLSSWAQDIAAPDTIKIESASLQIGRSLPISLSISNDQPIKCFNIGLITSSVDSGMARFDSIVYIGRMADAEIMNLRIGGAINADGLLSDTSVLSAFLAGPEMKALPRGNGAIVNIYFTGLKPGEMTIQNGFLPPGGNFMMMPYIGDFSEKMFTPVFVGIAIQVAPRAPFVCGNIDDSPEGFVDISDLTVFIDYLFISLQTPANLGAANMDGSPNGTIDISDLTYMIAYLFIGGPAPVCL